MNTIDEMVEVLQHKKNGGEVEYENMHGKWGEATYPIWNFDRHTYRPKPEPIEGWYNIDASCKLYGPYHTIEEARFNASNKVIQVYMRWIEK